jgi:hypothetical protein
LQRLRLENASALTADTSLSAGHLGELVAFDIGAMGFDRQNLLRELGGRPGSRLVSNGEAMALVRNGRIARHIGPLFAHGPAHALAMVRDIVAHEKGPLLIDAVANQDMFLKGLTELGWIIERPFQRMRFGRAIHQRAELSFAVAGPEFG